MSDTAHEGFPFGQEIVWRPSEEVIARSRLKRFMDRHGLATYADLMERSNSDIDWFTNAVIDHLDIEFYEPYSRVVDLSDGIPWAKWCVDGKMNVVHNCLDKWMDTDTQNRAALRWEGEDGATRLLTYRDLYREVNRVANALRAAGLGKGDAIGLYMPMIPEIVVALLAIAKIGGVILPLFSGFGPSAIVTRLGGAEAKALFTADGLFRRGRAIDMKSVADEALQDLPAVQTVIVYQHAGLDVPMTPGRDVWWSDFVAGQPAEADTERTDAEDLLMIIYTSGTTGRPKGAVHTHCGFPIKSAQDMAFGFDTQPFDTMMWMTDMGWMMGPFLVFGVLILGATMVLYDGAPDYPDVDRVWSLVERHGITILGLAPTFARAMMPYGSDPIIRHDLSTLRAIGSSGEAWNPEPWKWFFETVCRSEVPIINYSGGTEVSGGIVSGNMLLPLKPCAFAASVPGMGADVVDEDGNPVRGAVGELVLRQPDIGMTRGFWQDPDRYIETYWSRLENVWVHGDFAAIDEDGLWYILGRSDDTIKVAGKRVGPAEVESVLVEHDAVVEAAAVGIPDALKGQVIVGFVVLNSGYEPSEELRAELVEQIVHSMGKPLAPKDVRFVNDLPRTRNAKVMRRIIRAAYLDQPTGDTTALVNPAAVEEIRQSQ